MGGRLALHAYIAHEPNTRRVSAADELEIQHQAVSGLRPEGRAAGGSSRHNFNFVFCAMRQGARRRRPREPSPEEASRESTRSAPARTEPTARAAAQKHEKHRVEGDSKEGHEGWFQTIFLRLRPRTAPFERETRRPQGSGPAGSMSLRDWGVLVISIHPSPPCRHDQSTRPTATHAPPHTVRDHPVPSHSKVLPGRPTSWRFNPPSTFQAR